MCFKDCEQPCCKDLQLADTNCKDDLKHKWYNPNVHPFFFLTENKGSWDFWFKCDHCKIERLMKLTYTLEEI